MTSSLNIAPTCARDHALQSLVNRDKAVLQRKCIPFLTHLRGQARVSPGEGAEGVQPISSAICSEVDKQRYIAYDMTRDLSLQKKYSNKNNNKKLQTTIPIGWNDKYFTHSEHIIELTKFFRGFNVVVSNFLLWLYLMSIPEYKVARHGPHAPGKTFKQMIGYWKVLQLVLILDATYKKRSSCYLIY